MSFSVNVIVVHHLYIPVYQATFPSDKDICRSIWIAGPWINGILNIYKLGNYSLRTHVYWLNTFHLGIYQKIEGEKSIPSEMPCSDSPWTSWIAERPTWEDQVHTSITGTGQHWKSLVRYLFNHFPYFIDIFSAHFLCYILLSFFIDPFECRLRWVYTWWWERYLISSSVMEISDGYLLSVCLIFESFITCLLHCTCSPDMFCW